jgi:hypothetical protein
MAKLYARELRVAGELLDKAMRKRGSKMNSVHEGWALIREELDELWDEVKRKQDKHRPKKLRKEALQVAAIAIWFAMEVRNGACDRD